MQKALLYISFLLLFSCADEKPAYQNLQGNAFGTTFTISYKDVLNRDFSDEIDSLIYVVNKSLSTYMLSSDFLKNVLLHQFQNLLQWH